MKKFQKLETNNINFLGKKIMIIAAHPDDDILGCGGLLAKLKNNYLEVKVIFIGEGSSCRYNQKDTGRKKICKIKQYSYFPNELPVEFFWGLYLK